MVWQILTGENQDWSHQALSASTTWQHHKRALKETTENIFELFTEAKHFRTEGHQQLDWNSLPEEVVSAEMVNGFKNALDRHWRQHMYSIQTD